jgi:hypothetical protein
LLKLYVEANFFRPRPVIGKIEALLDQPVYLSSPAFAGALARVEQHILDDGVGAFAVLDNLAEVIF